MSTVNMFVTSWCPYCRKAYAMMEDLRKEDPKYRNVVVNIIDEEKDPDTAKKYDYYYVPTYFVNGEKVHEGVPTREIVRSVFDKALE
jgi:glutaredoxin